MIFGGLLLQNEQCKHQDKFKSDRPRPKDNSNFKQYKFNLLYFVFVFLFIDAINKYHKDIASSNAKNNISVGPKILTRDAI